VRRALAIYSLFSSVLICLAVSLQMLACRCLCRQRGGNLGFNPICDDICLSVTLPPFAASSHKRQRPSAWRAPQKILCSLAGAHTSIMVANSIPQGQVKAGDKIVNDVKLTNIPAGRFDGQLRPYSQADVEKLR